jgi:hypothetical protein
MHTTAFTLHDVPSDLLTMFYNELRLLKGKLSSPTRVCHALSRPCHNKHTAVYMYSSVSMKLLVQGSALCCATLVTKSLLLT